MQTHSPVGIALAIERRTTCNVQLPNDMKKQDRKLKTQTMNLGDLIMTVSSCSKNNRETVATVVDLLASGRVLVHSNGHASRALITR